MGGCSPRRAFRLRKNSQSHANPNAFVVGNVEGANEKRSGVGDMVVAPSAGLSIAREQARQAVTVAMVQPAAILFLDKLRRVSQSSASVMTPSFYSLFRRGRYHRPPSLTANERKEQERFAAAALAFTLRYDKRFCRDFLETVCGLPNGIAKEIPAVVVEGHNWADLLLELKANAVVIECKIDAPLAPRQNPEKETAFFRSKDGYGRAFVEAYKQRGDKFAKYYIVLGHRQPLSPKHRHGIKYFQKQWRDIMVIQTGELVKDFFNCLGNLGVPEFQSMRSDNMTIRDKAPSLARAAALLKDTCNDLESNKSEWEYESELETDCDWWWFGAEVRQSKRKSSRKLTKMCEMVRPEGKVGWFGYQNNAEGKSELSVWFYCSTKQSHDSVRRRLVRAGLTVRPKEANSEWEVVAVLPVESSTGDKEWFKSVFETLLD